MMGTLSSVLLRKNSLKSKLENRIGPIVTVKMPPLLENEKKMKNGSMG